MTFEDFYKDLKSDEVWFNQASMHHKPETCEDTARKIYTNGMVDVLEFRQTPMKEHRRYFFNKLSKITPDRPKKQWWVKDEDKKEVIQEAPPLTGEARLARLREWQEAIKQTPPVKTTPRLTSKMIEEEGGVRPKAVQPYPTTSLTEFQQHERHLAYIKYAYDARTGERIPGTLDEQEFNLTY